MKKGSGPQEYKVIYKLYTILDLKKQQKKLCLGTLRPHSVLRMWIFIGLEMELRLSFLQQYHISYYSWLSADLCTETIMGNVWNSD